MVKKKVKKYICPLSGQKFYHVADRDLYTELTQKEIEAKKRNLKPIPNERATNK